MSLCVFITVHVKTDPAVKEEGDSLPYDDLDLFIKDSVKSVTMSDMTTRQHRP